MPTVVNPFRLFLAFDLANYHIRYALVLKLCDTRICTVIHAEDFDMVDLDSSSAFKIVDNLALYENHIELNITLKTQNVKSKPD